MQKDDLDTKYFEATLDMIKLKGTDHGLGLAA